MQMVCGTRVTLPSGVLLALERYRYEVFVARLGWESLGNADARESDQFDRGDTVYVAALDVDGRVVGCARLLPTVRPYLLAEVFPELLGDLEPPCSDSVWELSRFSAVDLARDAAPPRVRWSSPTAVSLLGKALSCAGTHGARRLITVSPLGVERLLHRAGFSSSRVAEAVQIDGEAVFACWIDVLEDSCAGACAPSLRRACASSGF